MLNSPHVDVVIALWRDPDAPGGIGVWVAKGLPVLEAVIDRGSIATLPMVAFWLNCARAGSPNSTRATSRRAGESRLRLEWIPHGLTTTNAAMLVARRILVWLDLPIVLSWAPFRPWFGAIGDGGATAVCESCSGVAGHRSAGIAK
jgi:hypothetical protein